MLKHLVFCSLLIAAAGRMIPRPTANNHQKAFINFPCAVLIEPDDQKIASLKKSNSDDDYNTLVDDNEYYMSEATAFLDSVKLKQVQKLSNGSLFFKTRSGQTFEIKLDNLNWGILLFNGKTRPIIADMTTIERDYHNYMK